MLSRLPTGWLFGGAAIVAALGLTLNWLVPSGWYLYEPNRAKPLAERVDVEGGRDPSGASIHYVDVTLRPASWLERLAGVFRPDGATLVPDEEVVPHGSTFEARHDAAVKEMARSEEVAAAVALKQAGYEVGAKPRGALVTAVAVDVPAAGMLEDGDVIVRAGSRAVRTPADLRKATSTLKPGETLDVVVRRDGKRQTLALKTVPAPDDAERAIIGIRVAQDATIELPVKVKIDMGDVGGPSAGLPFALEILEELGNDVDGGKVVAATGELELDGSVSPIGGVKQKTIGARRAGVDVFLVPAGENADEARSYAGDMRVVAVESFQQALRDLATATANA